MVEAVVADVLPLFDAAMREYAYQRNREFERELFPQFSATVQYIQRNYKDFMGFVDIFRPENFAP